MLSEFVQKNLQKGWGDKSFGMLLGIVVGLLLLRTNGDLCFRRTDYVVRPSTGEEKRVFQEQVRRESS